MKRYLVLGLVFCVIATFTGCDALQRKFTRKKKPAPKAPRIYQLKKYTKTPSSELYKKHYAYWSSWHDELIRVLGQNHKKDMRCMEEIIGNLADMQDILVPEKGDAMKPHIEKLVRTREIISAGQMSQPNQVYVRTTLEREARFIKREFNFTKVKGCFKESFEEEPKEEPADVQPKGA